MIPYSYIEECGRMIFQIIETPAVESSTIPESSLFVGNHGAMLCFIESWAVPLRSYS